MSTTTIVYPSHYRIIRRESPNWYFTDPEVFYNPSSVPTKDIEQYNTTYKQITFELFRINAGRNGYYLANLKGKKYYYCGAEWQDLKNKLRELGIGRIDPIEKHHG